MSRARPSVCIAVAGDRRPGQESQSSIPGALADSAAHLGVDVEVLWYETEALASAPAPDLLHGADGVWGAPGSPFASLEGALAPITWAREHDVPFLGTCAGFQHGVVEFARNVLGVADAQHAEYDPDASDLFIHELLCSLAGQTLEVGLVDPWMRARWGSDLATERYYCRFGLNPAQREAIEGAGLRVAGVDAADSDPRILRLEGHPFFVLTLFVPQTNSAPERPHPLITAFLEAASRDGHTARGVASRERVT